ncbi:hypothetical protein PLESTB_001365100 [Pleodorina starrii]|uniref:Uncharacterized protein n=1 Tax=Pleodorina starrii TaxID=330485 RepID=A0A9W6BU74_9CHLO|nr:hypothetical protein PLESTM_000419900 [Pleodorina starrii]GLC58474.1 hypothetical protein PLESTB_001365100 [Pleodorina starrii]GLC74132.1 hypothetical protein PLESTF_001465300 [Pleodorina starrii]
MIPLRQLLLRLRTRRYRGLIQRLVFIGSRILLALLVLLALRQLYNGVKLYRAGAHLRAAKTAAQDLRSLLQSAGLRQCFASIADGKGAHSNLCDAASQFLSRIQAAGLVLPLPQTGGVFTVPGICAGGCFLATNVRDAELVMPNYIYHTVLTVASLTHHGNPAFVSVYESGSKDRTPAWLQVLGDVLDALSVPHHLELHGTIQREKGEERIHFLARVRSAALLPLYQLCSATGQFCAPPTGGRRNSNINSINSIDSSSSSSFNSSGRVIFLNDVLFTGADVLRLLQYPADLVCGLDLGMAAEPDMTVAEHRDTLTAYLHARWLLPRGLARRLARWGPLRKRWRKFHHTHEPLLREYGPLFFYDKWVARDISGRMFTNRAPYVVYEPSVARVVAGRPVRVHCCWNGLAVITAQPFVERAVDFREHREDECSASECSLLCDDMWRLGYDNMIMDPNVRVTYDLAGANKLFKSLSTPLPLGVPGVAYAPFRQTDVREAMSLPKHDDISRESSNVGGPGKRMREVDCCDLKKGADMVEFRDEGVCHTSMVVVG